MQWKVDSSLGVDSRGDHGCSRRLYAGARRVHHSSIATALLVVAWIGTITAVMAALIATQQDESTHSRYRRCHIGYMVMAVGLASNRRPCSTFSLSVF